ncbi:hypothetical protein H4Q26_014875 [Puccinia striiformis f. sp. tritici PST-130]|uniref:Ubiquitin carboxyl-terminal hydrolase 7 ICP0-binding domain-containing protein n=1 Tax=Puccinia striiformis f. sp. tritici PST-78 TaxID=1165861 RepID=A0A0L0V0M6_9BASI|nr:hypothetical protein H4Q26_014875 [Puccinia striiformis f. sp. tritici PST-130]KNE92837.1 hypothetical protein PSTG_13749 [Puccinia striiformis f. sp. tritici PST-78]
MIDPMKPKATFMQSEIQAGDIICFQIELSDKELAELEEQRLYLDPVTFYDFFTNRVLVQFKPRCDDMSTSLDHQGNPKNVICRAGAQGTVADMIQSSYNNAPSNVLFCELLDMSIIEIETKRNVQVTWTGAHNREEVRESSFKFLSP